MAKSSERIQSGKPGRSGQGSVKGAVTEAPKEPLAEESSPGSSKELPRGFHIAMWLWFGGFLAIMLYELIAVIWRG